MLKAIAENFSAAAVAAAPGVAFAKTPHLPARQMAVLLTFASIVEAGVVKIQTSDSAANIADGAAVWADAATVNVAVGDISKVVTIQSAARVRVNVTDLAGAGSKVSAYALAL